MDSSQASSPPRARSPDAMARRMAARFLGDVAGQETDAPFASVATVAASPSLQLVSPKEEEEEEEEESKEEVR